MTHGVLHAALSAKGRDPHDFYPTPPEAVRALLPHISDFPHLVWEPACGDGALVHELLRGHVREVVATDIAPQPNFFGIQADFLLEPTRRADAIVTNPPFGNLAQKFIEKAFRLDVPYIAMLLNTNFWHAASRQKLFASRPPDVIHPLTWRLDFTGSRRPYFNCCWTVWRPNRGAFPYYIPLHRPK